MSDIPQSVSNNLAPNQAVSVFITPLPYGAVAKGNMYFGGRLNTVSWDTASDIDKLKALTAATIAIDRLNFKGNKSDAGQSRQFPRGIALPVNTQFPTPICHTPNPVDTVVPVEIEMACYEQAYALLDGIDPEYEFSSMQVSSRKYDSLRTTYDTAKSPLHIMCGIVSREAWLFLIPFLRNPTELVLSRV